MNKKMRAFHRIDEARMNLWLPEPEPSERFVSKVEGQKCKDAENQVLHLASGSDGEGSGQ